MRRHFPPDAPSTPRTTTSSTPPDTAREHILLRLLQDLFDFFGPPASSTRLPRHFLRLLRPPARSLLREGCGAAAPRCHPYTPWADPTSRLSQYPCCFRPAASRPCIVTFRPDPVASSRASCVGRRDSIRLSLGSCKLASQAQQHPLPPVGSHKFTRKCSCSTSSRTLRERSPQISRPALQRPASVQHNKQTQTQTHTNKIKNNGISTSFS